MTAPIRVGTRGSRLARAQTETVLRRLRRSAPGRAFETRTVLTAGDRTRRRERDLDFTGALADALREDRIDLAVHSLKDLPVRDPADLPIWAYPPRADPRDAVVARRWPLPRGAVVGSSSVRRRAELARWRPDLRLVPVRGNVDTRIGFVRSGAVAAVVLARAGLLRLGRAREAAALLPLEEFLPAPGQGILAVQGRSRDRALRALVRRIDDDTARHCGTIERTVAAELGGSCDLPLGVWARRRARRTRVDAEVLAPDGRRSVRLRRVFDDAAPEGIGRAIAQDLRRLGALEVMGRRA